MFLNTSSEYSPTGLYYPYDFQSIEINEIHFNDDNFNSVEAQPDNDHHPLVLAIILLSISCHY